MTDSAAPIGPDVLTDQMGDLPKAADRLRQAGLEYAALVQQSRLGAANRWQALVQARYPDDGETIARLQSRVTAETQMQRGLELGVQTAAIEVPPRTAGVDVIHGLVRDQRGAATAGLTVAAIEATGQVRRYACTDGKGYFRMDLPVTPGTAETVFLQVSGPDQAVLYRGGEAIALADQGVVYRLIELSGERKPPCSAPPERATMPSLLLQPEAVALATLGRLGLKIGQRLTQRDPEHSGLVLSHEPAAGTAIDSRTSVTLVIGAADPADTVKVPELVGATQDQAADRLKKAGLEVGATSSRPSEPAGLVLSQDPAAGIAVAPRTAVALTLSVQPTDQRIGVPDVAGAMLEEAWRLVENKGLARGGVGFRDDPREGRVLAQEPPAGTLVEKLSRVNLTLGRRSVSERTKVPDLSGQTFTDARGALAAARLQLGGVIGPQDGRVTDQTEEAGGDVAVGTPVAITLAKGGGDKPPEDYCKRLASAMAAEPDCQSLGLKLKALRAMLTKAGITDSESAKCHAELSEAELQKKLELQDRKQARDFKRLLKVVLERL
jgi:beta-lactam-binding protein with PASTA domain